MEKRSYVLLRLFGLAIAIGLLACAFYLLSWLPVPILNGILLWLCWITVSALFAPRSLFKLVFCL